MAHASTGLFLEVLCFFPWSIYRFKGLKIEDMTFAVKILLCLQTSQYRGFGDVLIGVYRSKKYQIKLGVAFVANNFWDLFCEVYTELIIRLFPKLFDDLRGCSPYSY